MRPRGITRGNRTTAAVPGRRAAAGFNEAAGVLPAETRRARYGHDAAERAASMRPRGITRGNVMSSIRHAHSVARFNEAAGYYPRKPEGGSTAGRGHAAASMRPRGITRGNSELESSSEAPYRTASMRPRGITRGNDTPVGSVSFTSPASMRPRGITRGNGFCQATGWRSTHASMRPRGITRGNRRSLPGLRAGQSSFNEAAGYYPRKRSLRQDGSTLGILASMRPRGITRGNKIEAGLNFLRPLALQ